MSKVTSVMIVCKKRYSEVATISVPSFIRHHPGKNLCILADASGIKALSGISGKGVKVVPLGKIRKVAAAALRVSSFQVFKYGKEHHDRAYSSMKPLLMELAVAVAFPATKYIMGLDSDSIFTGNIMDKVEGIVERDAGKYELYMVQRTDPRMLVCRGKNPAPGSGFVLWARSGRYISLFKKMFIKKYTRFRGGGSQGLTNMIRRKIPSRILTNPAFHFVSPDLKKPNITDAEILAIGPAYIHLHGAESFSRLERFRKVFDG